MRTRSTVSVARGNRHNRLEILSVMAGELNINTLILRLLNRVYRYQYKKGMHRILICRISDSSVSDPDPELKKRALVIGKYIR